MLLISTLWLEHGLQVSHSIDMLAHESAYLFGRIAGLCYIAEWIFEEVLLHAPHLYLRFVLACLSSGVALSRLHSIPGKPGCPYIHIRYTILLTLAHHFDLYMLVTSQQSLDDRAFPK